MGTWSLDTVEKALGAVVAAATGLTTIWQSQPGPRPAKPYASLSWTAPGIPLAPRPERRRGGGGDGIDQLVEQRAATVQVSVFTTETVGDAAAYAKAELARDGLPLTASQEALASAGVAVVERGPTRDMSAMQDWRVEGHALFEFRLVYALTSNDNVSWIDTAEWTATITEG